MANDGCQPLSMGGKLVGYNRDNQAGISFPASATSYRDLRLGAGGGGGGGGGSCVSFCQRWLPAPSAVHVLLRRAAC